MTYEELQERYMCAKEKFERNQFKKKLRDDMISVLAEANQAMRRMLNKVRRVPTEKKY